jgi:hypothetical protein
MGQQNEIQLILTDDLITELCGRFEHSVFAGLQTKVYNPTDVHVEKHFEGNHATCAGLCSQLQYFINKDDIDSANYNDEKDLTNDT